MHGTHWLGCMSQPVVGLCIHTATRDRFGGLLFFFFFFVISWIILTQFGMGIKYCH